MVNEINNKQVMDIKEKITRVIQDSELPVNEKQRELDFLQKAVVGNALNLPYIQNNIEKTAFAKLYAFLAGYTDVDYIEDDDLKVNIRFFNKLGDIASGLGQIIPGASIAASVLGTSSTCGLIGGLFNTKKCREKQQAQQTSAAQFLNSQIQNPTIAKPQYVTTVEPIIRPQGTIQPNQTQQPQHTVQSNQSNNNNNNMMIMLLGAAVVAFFLFNKKR